MVEHFLGKEEVGGSIPLNSSIKIEKNLNGKTVVNIRTSLNAEFNQEKIEKLEAFLADLDDKV